VFNENIGRIVEQYLQEGLEGLPRGARFQSRKYNDQSGAERYITEIVLQRFRGELTLLDSRNGGESRDSLGAGEERAPSFGRSSPAERRPALVSGGGGAPAAAGISTTTSRSEG